MDDETEDARVADENAPAAEGFDPVAVARQVLRTSRTGALATLDAASGAPFASLVTVATETDGTPVILMSGLSAHTQNLDRDGRASLLLAAGGRGDPLAHPRVTVTGRVERTEDAASRRRFLARHPKAGLYADFGDFSFRRLIVEGAHLNGGFARAAKLRPAELLLDLAGAVALRDVEASAVEHMNTDHAEALELYATKLAGVPAGRWRLTGVDPEGLDLADGDRTVRLLFPERVTDAGSLRRATVRLAEQARAG